MISPTHPGHATPRAPGGPVAPAVATVGSLLAGRYLLEAEIGAGGMGVVYRARDAALDRAVAIKAIALAGEAARARFRREARATALVRHPGLIAVYDVGETPAGPFLVMELLTGASLRQRLACRAVTLVEALTWTAAIADAVAVAHDVGLIHRDLKPDNVFLDRTTGDERVVVLDFGLAFVVGADAESVGRLTAVGETAGTPEYMSPEQSLGGEVGRPADAYALGCLLFELCAGEPPWTGAAAMVMARHVYAQPPALRALTPDVPVEVAALVHDLLAKAPAARPELRAVAARCRAAIAAAPIARAPDRAHRMITRRPPIHVFAAGPTEVGPSDLTTAVHGDAHDDVMLALAAAGLAAVRAGAPRAATAAAILAIEVAPAELRALLTRGVPVIASARAGDLAAATALLQAGAADVVTLPLAPDAAARKVLRALRPRRRSPR